MQTQQRFPGLIAEGTMATYQGGIDSLRGFRGLVEQCTGPCCDEAWSAGEARYLLLDRYDAPKLRHVRQQSLVAG